jgi:hypothetical protein
MRKNKGKIGRRESANEDENDGNSQLTGVLQ